MFDLPETLPRIVIAAGGPEAARLAGKAGDGMFATEPRTDLVAAYREAGGAGPVYAEVPLAWAPDEAQAVASAHRQLRFGPTEWKMQAELTNPVNFEAATAFVTEDDMRQVFGCGPDPARHLEVAKQFVDAGFDHLTLLNAGPDPDWLLRVLSRRTARTPRQAHSELIGTADTHSLQWPVGSATQAERLCRAEALVLTLAVHHGLWSVMHQFAV